MNSQIDVTGAVINSGASNDQLLARLALTYGELNGITIPFNDQLLLLTVGTLIFDSS